MRVTESMRIAQTAQTLQDSAKKVFDLSTQASTGRVLNKPSDSPAVYASVVSRAERMELLESRQGTLQRAEDDIALAENTLASASDIMIRVREIAVAMADAEPGPTERTAMAREVANLREHLIGLANTKGTRGFLFGGTLTQTQPFTNAGVFQGNDGEINVEYADGQTTGVNVSGVAAFTNGLGGRDVFQDLADLEADLLANDQAAVHLQIDNIEAGRQQMTSVRIDAGVKMNRFASSLDVTNNALVVVTAAQASERDGETTEIFSGLATAQAAYERSLAVTRQVLAMATSMERF